MTASYDAVVVGAGHNGLVAANYLARAGRKVLVLEARDVVGGACVTEEIIPGSRWSSCAFIAGLARPEIVNQLELHRFGLEMYQTDSLGFSLHEDGSRLLFYKELDRTLHEIERHSRREAQRFLQFGARLRRFGDYMRPWILRPPPSREELRSSFAANGEEELYEEFMVMSTRELLDRYFETEHVKGWLTFFGIVSIWGGPSTSGTGFVYGHHSSGEFEGHFGEYGFVRGGMGGITQALANAARAFGAEIRTNAPVDRILIEDGRVVGVALESGDEFRAPVVVSNADPKRTLLRLVDARDLDPAFRSRVEGIDQRGSMARVHVLIDELPAYLGFPDATEGPQHRGHQMVGATVENFEKAWEAQQRGTFPDEYAIEAVIQSTSDPTLAPNGLHTLTLGVQQTPFELADGTWDDVKEAWGDRVIENFCRYAPNLRDHIIDKVVITPQDLDRDYHLTGGNIFHAAMFEDHLFDQRPLPELSSYRTPVSGLYLCGAGTHPGGGVVAAPGHNAAQVVLSDSGLEPQPAANGQARVGQIPVLDRIMATQAGSRLGYELARRRAFRPFAKLATKTRKGG